MIGKLLRSAMVAFALTAGVGLTAASLFVQPLAAQQMCRDDSVMLRGDWGQARFTVELANTPQTRSQGLMFRESMPKIAGMLFIYDSPQRATFWMRNTLIPLDMIFTDDTGLVRHVHHNAIPGDETTIDGGDGILTVLEINGGLARAMGIVEGSEMRHPAFAQDSAAWPCEGQID